MHRLADRFSEQRTADRRCHRDVALLELQRVTEDEVVGFLRARLLVLDDDLGPKSDPVVGDLRRVDRRQLAQALSKMAEPRLDELLPLESSLVLAVLAQVAMLDSLPDFLRKGDVQLVLKPLDLFTKLLLQRLDHSGIQETKIAAPGRRSRAPSQFQSMP